MLLIIINALIIIWSVFAVNNLINFLIVSISDIGIGNLYTVGL